jgi:hypothetical protein
MADNLPPQTQSRIAAGLARWSDLAAMAGLPAEGWQATLLWSRQDANGDRTVVRLSHAEHPAVVVKQSHRQGEAARMAAGLDAQRRACAALRDHPLARVPRVLGHLVEDGAALIEAVDGLPLMDLANGPAALRAVARAGAWLDAFHRSDAPPEAQPFGPRIAARRALRAAEALNAGQASLPKPRLFAEHAAALRAAAPRLRGAETLVAPRHGDLSARNLLIGASLVWGIDFAAEARAPVGADIAKLLTFLALRMPDPGPDPLGRQPGSLRVAFHEGYRLGAAADPTLNFLLCAQLLADWAACPADPAAMSAPLAARFRRIVGLLARLSPDLS